MRFILKQNIANNYVQLNSLNKNHRFHNRNNSYQKEKPTLAVYLIACLQKGLQAQKT